MVANDVALVPNDSARRASADAAEKSIDIWVDEAWMKVFVHQRLRSGVSVASANLGQALTQQLLVALGTYKAVYAYFNLMWIIFPDFYAMEHNTDSFFVGDDSVYGNLDVKNYRAQISGP